MQINFRRTCEQLQNIGVPISIGSTAKALAVSGQQRPDFDVLLVFDESFEISDQTVGKKHSFANRKHSDFYKRIKENLKDMGSIREHPPSLIFRPKLEQV
tara:strand:+ start:514 stop:813 length:300 start_codon:yes stop_codon:yes gene_type:complete